MKSLSLVTLRLAVLIAVLSWSFVDVATACNSCLTTCTLCKKDTTCGVCNLAVESQSSSAQTTGYVLLNSKWNLGPNNATFIDPNNPPATPGSVTWSPLPNGVSGNVSGYDGHPDNSTDIEFLITGAVDGLEYQLFNEALDVWASHASIYNLGQVADSGAAVGASEVQGGHIGDIRVGGFTFDGPGGGLAHALQPAVEWMGTTFGGDVHFDIGENWTNGGGGGTDFKTVAIHELGHSLGLGHSNATFSVMAPFYAGIQHNLYRDDIVGIQALYGTDYAANASFNSGSDTNTLNIDFGSFTLGDPAAPISFDISNLQQVGSTATLSSSNVVGSGSTVALTTDYSSFSYLVAGTTSNSFDAMIDTTVPGVHAATYEFNFTDVTGANQTITLNLTGEVSNVDDPNRPDMVYNVATGEVIIDQRDVSTLNSYNFDSAGQFIPGNHTPFLLGGIPNSTVNNISDVSTIPSSAPTSIGAILPSGLSLGDLANLLDTRTATTMFGQPTVDFDIDFVCGGGDADCDGYVSNLEDIQQAFTNFTGPGTTTSNFSLLRADGDVQGDLLGIGDDDVDNLDIQAMFTNFNPPPDVAGDVIGGSGDGDPAIPDLIYDPVTGEVVIDWEGNTLISYVLKNATNSFIPGNYSTILLGSFPTATNSELSESTSFAEPGVTTRSMGNVFPTGLDLAGLQSLLTVNSIILTLGGPQLPFDLVVTGPPVPEPSTYALAAMALLSMMLIGCRSRRQ